MNQEEMFAQLLNKMDERFDKMEQNIADMREDLSGVKEDVSSLKGDVAALKEDITSLKSDMNEVKEDVQSTRQIVARMEIEHGQKLDVLFDADTRDHEKIVEDILPRLDKHDQQIDKLEQHVVSLKRA